MDTRYILVEWPESQSLMEHERFHECLLVQDIEGHDEAGSSAYMCPEDLYEEVFNKDAQVEYIWKKVHNDIFVSQNELEALSDDELYELSEKLPSDNIMVDFAHKLGYVIGQVEAY